MALVQDDVTHFLRIAMCVILFYPRQAGRNKDRWGWSAIIEQFQLPRRYPQKEKERETHTHKKIRKKEKEIIIIKIKNNNNTTPPGNS